MALPQVVGTIEDDSSLKANVASRIEGFSGSDIITGSKFADVIFGGDSAWGPGPGSGHYVDGVYRNIGDDDTIDAGDGNDIINVGAGTDSIDGGAGLDQLDFFHDSISTFFTIQAVEEEGQSKYVPHATSLHNLVIDIKTGTYSGDYVGGDGKTYGHNSGRFKSIEAILGSSHNDIIRGSNHNDQFKPISGDDAIDGRKGFDVLSYNDAGPDGIVVNWSTAKVRDSFGETDTFENIEQIIGTAHDDRFNGTTGQQIFTGGNGADTFNGGAGIDIVDYHLEIGDKGLNLRLVEGKGQDSYGSIDEFDGIEDIRGTAHADIVSGNDARNEFWGDDGNDNLGGAGQNDTLHGGTGKDILGGGEGDDQLFGDDGNDSLNGGPGQDVLNGGEGNDGLKGGSDADTIHGDDGDDTIDGQGADDKIYGDYGDDTLTDVSLGENPLGGYFGNTLNGGAGADTIDGVGFLNGDEGNDKLSGQGSLDGGAGDDSLRGDFIDDKHVVTYLSGGAGHDLLSAGKGDDGWFNASADYGYATHGIIATMETNTVKVTGSDTDTLSHITSILGSKLDDKMFADSGGDHFFAGAGNDSLKGSGGNDVMFGDEGDDTLIGGAGDDGLYGDDGDDVIRTGAGKDDVDGGGGNDKIYVDGSVPNVDTVMHVRGGSGADTITLSAFTSAKVDAGSGSDKIIIAEGYASNGSTLTGGSGSDVFIFRWLDSQQEHIDDFKSGTDRIDISTANIHGFSDLAAHYLSDVGNDTLIEVGNTKITINHLNISDLHVGDFIF